MCCEPAAPAHDPSGSARDHEPDGTPPRFVAERAGMGSAALQYAWVTGTGVDELLDDLTPASLV